MIESENMTARDPSTEPVSLRELLKSRARQAPHKVFLFSEADERRYTYAQFDAAVNRAAHLLLERGEVAKGDKVGLLMPNSVEYIIAYFACFKLGAIAGPINSLLKTQELSYVLANSEAKALLVHSEFKPRVDAIEKELPDLRHVIEFDDEARATA
ncbi:MAG TPA: AMP-binding protein, partial [Pyrinomonadaceae bacterium]